MNCFKKTPRLGLLNLLVMMVLFPFTAQSQQTRRIPLTLEEVVETAREQSQASLIAKHNFLASYWQFRSYKAKLLPSLNLNASLGQYNRSITALQNSQTGEFNYIVNNNMNNNLSLSVNQSIAPTGGTLSLITSLSRLDQFSSQNPVTYTSQPVKINYSQPIKAYNSLKWEKTIEPLNFEKAKREYLERLEDVNITAVSLFFSVLSAQINLDMALKNLENTELSLDIAKERFEIGTISRNDVLTLNLRLINSRLDIGDKQLELEMSKLNLRTFLGFNESVELVLITPEQTPDLTLNYEDVYSRSIENSSYVMGNELLLLGAEQSVARAKSSTGLQANLFANFGLNQRGENLSKAYSNPMDQEVVGLSLTLPILDWGMGKGNVKLARSREEVIRTQVEQSMTQYKQDVLIKVMQFNKLNDQCNISLQADSIAKLSFDIANERFRNGTITVIELNSAQNDMTSAASRYIADLGNYWKNYYNIRKLSLYDYLTGEGVNVNFDLLTEN
ncbi:MAG: TolC family protein [Bacteroidia bacterium]|nr:TolC family protein [Bacteroidia bacterium]